MKEKLFLLLGSLLMMLGLRISPIFISDILTGLVGFLLVLFSGVFWISAAIEWE